MESSLVQNYPSVQNGFRSFMQSKIEFVISSMIWFLLQKHFLTLIGKGIIGCYEVLAGRPKSETTADL